jgi:hypothetical protein
MAHTVESSSTATASRLVLVWPNEAEELYVHKRHPSMPFFNFDETGKRTRTFMRHPRNTRKMLTAREDYKKGIIEHGILCATMFNRWLLHSHDVVFVLRSLRGQFWVGPVQGFQKDSRAGACYVVKFNADLH